MDESQTAPVEESRAQEAGGAAPPAFAPPPAVLVAPSRKMPFVIGLGSGCLIAVAGLFFLLFLAAFGDRRNDVSWGLGNKVAVVPIEGEITESREAVERLRDYSENSSVRAIIVRINSPGGAVAPSQEIFSEIRRIRAESHKPIIASVDSVAASGGYYIAVACDQIVANPGSITGSIGVIAQWFNLEDLLKWAKVKPETVISGAMKDMGSPYRPMRDDERAYFQSIVTQLRGQFVRAVAEGRKGKISAAEIDKLADGRVFTGEQAEQLHLIDRIGSLRDAADLAGRLGGIHGEPHLLYPRRRVPGILDVMNGSRDSDKVFERILSGRFSPFLYRW